MTDSLLCFNNYFGQKAIDTRVMIKAVKNVDNKLTQ